MNAPERIGQQLPELLEELALPRVPDYFDDLLRTTAATRQQPSWASPERWLPVSSITRPAPFGLPSWQPILLVAALLLATAIGGLLIVGSMQPRVPAPFGPAENGVLLASTLEDGLVAIDPATAVATAFGSSSNRFYPWHSPDGTQMLFYTMGEDGKVAGLYIARSDGSDARLLLADAADITWVEWSPSGREILAMTKPRLGQQLWVFDAVTLEPRALDLDLYVHEPVFTPAGDIVFKGSTPFPDVTWAYYVSSITDPQPRPLIPPAGNEVFGFSVSPDGSSLVYTKWDTPRGIVGQVWAVDIATEGERPLDLAGYGPGVADLNAKFSPDGALLLVHRFENGLGRHVIVRADGSGMPVVLGPGPDLVTSDTPERLWSPDGSTVAIRYPGSNEVWVYDAVTGEGRQVEGITAEGLSWQRTAP